MLTDDTGQPAIPHKPEREAIFIGRLFERPADKARRIANAGTVVEPGKPFLEMGPVPIDQRGEVLRIGLGASLGAFALLHAHVREPQVFDALFLQSGSYFQRSTDPQESDFGRYGRMTRFVSGVLRGRAAGRPVPVTLTCGRDEENLANNRNMAAALAASGYDVCFRSVPGGHDWPTWRRGLETNLVELFSHL